MIAKIILDAGRGQALGVASQLMSALPILLVSVIVAKRAGIEALVDLTTLVGFSAIISTIALMGLRTQLILDRMETINFGSYCALRVLMTLVTVIAIVAFGIINNMELALVLTLALFRLGDLFLDLVLAVDQTRLESATQLYAFFVGNLVKCVAVISGIMALLLFDFGDPFPLFLAAAILYAIYATGILVVRWRAEAQVNSEGRWRVWDLIFLVRASSVFMMAQVLCSLLTSYPRLVLGSGEKSAALGVAGAALMATTLVGMVYYAVWLRWAPRLRKHRITPASVVPFLLELLVISVVGAALALTFGAKIVAAIYSIEGMVHLRLVEQILAWSVAFFALMTLANLFKPTTVPWAESITYMVGLAAAFGLHGLYGDVETWELLAVAAYGMFAVEMAFLVVLTLRRKRSVAASC